MTEEIKRFAIIKGEHCCFGHFEEFNAECETCDAYQDCEVHTNGSM
jgi:hypothetical protein